MGAAAPRPPIGFVSVAFERGFDATSALYEAIVENNGPQKVGEILVHTVSDSPDRLDVAHDWVVHVDGVRRGRNVLGGVIEIPEVTFLRYEGPPANAKPVEQSLNVNGNAASSDPSAISCCAAAAQLVQHPFEYRGTWDLSMQLFPAIGNGIDVELTRFPGTPITVLSYNHSISEDETLFQVNFGDGSRFADLVVLAPASQAQSLDLKRDWLVEPMGTENLINGIGGRVAVTKIRFLRYAE